jgi:hypothetical protein
LASIALGVLVLLLVMRICYKTKKLKLKREKPLQLADLGGVAVLENTTFNL